MIVAPTPAHSIGVTIDVRAAPRPFIAPQRRQAPTEHHLRLARSAVEEMPWARDRFWKDMAMLTAKPIV